MKKTFALILTLTCALFAFVLGVNTSVNAESTTKTFVSADYTVTNANWKQLSLEAVGMQQATFGDRDQLTCQNEGYDGAGQGMWLTYKVEASNGSYIDALEVHCVGNRLGSFGKAAGATGVSLDFKVFVSTTPEFADAAYVNTQPESTECYNADYKYSVGEAKEGTYYVKVWFGSNQSGVGFYYDWFQLGTVTINGSESALPSSSEAKTFVSANYTVTNANWKQLSLEAVGLQQVTSGDKDQLMPQTEGYDGAGQGMWLTYKVDAGAGSYIDALEVHCVGNRLGSFGKAAGATGVSLDFKVFVSTTTEFAEAAYVNTQPESTECYNADYVYNVGEAKEQVYFVKVWFGSNQPGMGFYFDWFQLGTVTINGSVQGQPQEEEKIDASNAIVTLDKNEYTVTGTEIKPVVTVEFNAAELIYGLDYTYEYADNVNVGTGSVTITFTGSFTGTQTKYFEIVPMEEIEYNTTGLSDKTYAPDKYDFVDYWGGCGDIEVADGDGVTTFAHASFLTALNGKSVKFLTSFQLLSKSADDVDGWVTYSLSNNPGVDGNDKSYPYYGGQATGYFLHITNYSTNENPNCVEIQFVKMCKNGDAYMDACIDKFFVDNLCTNTGVLENATIKFVFEFYKNENSSWTLKLTNAATEEVIVEKNYAVIDETLFINEYGQTYLSTAIYEGPGCDGDHWLHRGVNFYNLEVFTKDAANATATLDTYEYEYTEGTIYRPQATVALGEVTLVKDVDYYVEYTGNREIGTATAYIIFIGEYAGNERKMVDFVIKEKGNPVGPGTQTNAPTTTTAPAGTTTVKGEDTTDAPAKAGCKNSILGFAFAPIALGACAVLLKKKRENE